VSTDVYKVSRDATQCPHVKQQTEARAGQDWSGIIGLYYKIQNVSQHLSISRGRKLCIIPNHAEPKKQLSLFFASYLLVEMNSIRPAADNSLGRREGSFRTAQGNRHAK
jgi:hypothetical protein